MTNPKICLFLAIALSACSSDENSSSDAASLARLELPANKYVDERHANGWVLQGSKAEEWSVFYRSKIVTCNEGDTINAAFEVDRKLYEKNLSGESIAILGRPNDSEELAVAVFRRAQPSQ